jgi:hypothetical protein
MKSTLTELQRWLHALLPGALLAGGAAAQARHPCLGTVVDADGKALGGAAVTLVWSPGDGAPGEFDVVQTSTDARGRFKADLVVSHAYSAWAIGPAAADGTRSVSEVTDRAAAGRVLELAAWHVQRPRRISCGGGDAWTNGAQPRLQLLPDARNSFAVALPEAKDSRVELPPTPWITAAIGLLDGEGRLVQLQPLPPEADHVAFAGMSEIDVKVVDEHDQPVAGAVIEHDVASNSGIGRGGDGMFTPASCWRWHVCATTAADGTARVRMPDLPTQTGIRGWVRVTTPTGMQAFAPVLAGAEVKSPQLPDGPLLVRAPHIDVSAGRIAGIRADELGFAELTTEAEYSVPRASYGLQLVLPVALRGDGAFSLSAAPVATSDASFLVHLLPRGAGAPRFAFVAPAKNAAQRLPQVDLASLRTWRVTAVDEHNNPLPGAEVALLPTSTARGGRGEVHPLVLDHAGRTDVLLDATEWAIYASTGSAHALEFVDAGTGGGELRLQLQPLPTLRLCIIDADGKPVRGARAAAVSGAGFSGVLRGPRGWSKESIAVRIALHVATSVTSDRDGTLVLPVQDWRPMRVQVQVRAGERQSEPIPLVAADNLQTVVVK